MGTFDKDATENPATPKGAGGGLQSKGLTKPEAGAADAPRQQEDAHQPETPDQKKTTADSSQTV